MKPRVGIFVIALLAACTSPEDAHSQTDRAYIAPGNVIGPYTPAVRVGGMLFVSGQIALDPATGNLVNDNIAAETRQVLANLRRVLTASGFDSSEVVNATVYLKNMADYAAMNAVYEQFFPKGKYPARVAVQVAALPRQANIEISVIAAK